MPLRYAENMNRMAVSLIVPLLLASSHGLAQTGPTLVGTAYFFPTPSVAPGQIVRLQVTGLKTVLPVAQKATSVPLPTSLAGITVNVRQYVERFFGDTLEPLEPQKALLVSIRQFSVCRNQIPVSDCLMTILTIQIPFAVNDSVVGNPRIYSELVISENGVDSQPFTVGVVPDMIHVVTPCDSDLSSVCRSTVTHADGSVVSAQSPAIAGETLVIYAWGLGDVTPGVKAGETTPIPAPVAQAPIRVRFDFSPNAAPKFYDNPPPVIGQAFLTPGQVGLYQVNVQLPQTFPPLLACGQGVDTNLTINLRGPWSHDGAAICVQPTQ